MFKLSTISAGLVLGAVLASSAAASDWGRYGTAGGWTVFKNAATGGCMMEAVEDGNVVQMGVGSPDANFGFVGVFTTAAVDIKAKQNIVLDLDGEQFKAKAFGVTDNITPGFQGGYFHADNPQFIDDLANKYVMTVNPGEEGSFEISLDGTKRAMEMTRECLTN